MLHSLLEVRLQLLGSLQSVRLQVLGLLLLKLFLYVLCLLALLSLFALDLLVDEVDVAVVPIWGLHSDVLQHLRVRQVVAVPQVPGVDALVRRLLRVVVIRVPCQKLVEYLEQLLNLVVLLPVLLLHVVSLRRTGSPFLLLLDQHFCDLEQRLILNQFLHCLPVVFPTSLLDQVGDLGQL